MPCPARRRSTSWRACLVEITGSQPESSAFRRSWRRSRCRSSCWRCRNERTAPPGRHSRLEDITVRIAAVSDIHGNLPALDAVMADIARNHVDQVVNLGDCFSGPLWPAETCDRLMELGWPALAGNHERRMMEPGAASRDNADGFAAARLTPDHGNWIASLPSTMILRDDLFVC